MTPVNGHDDADDESELYSKHFEIPCVSLKEGVVVLGRGGKSFVICSSSL